MSVVIPQRKIWTDQPQCPVSPNREIITELSHLWIPCGMPNSFLDIAGGWDAYQGVYSTVFANGSQGVAWLGDGSAALWNETGIYTSVGFGADWGTNTASTVSSHTVFALVEFDSLAGTAEYSILRVDNGTSGSGNYMLALDVFPFTKTIRPLVKTSGTSGWTVNNDKVHAEIVVNTPLIIAYRYTDGSPIESLVCPVGGTPVWTKTATNVTGGVRQNAASPGCYAHIGGLGSTNAASNFPGKIYKVGMVPYSMPDRVMQSIVNNPWIVCAS